MNSVLYLVLNLTVTLIPVVRIVLVTPTYCAIKYFSALILEILFCCCCIISPQTKPRAQILRLCGRKLLLETSSNGSRISGSGDDEVEEDADDGCVSIYLSLGSFAQWFASELANNHTPHCHQQTLFVHKLNFLPSCKAL